jgi:putative methionine-R-sulfoxide reductase with GAF domain
VDSDDNSETGRPSPSSEETGGHMPPSRDTRIETMRRQMSMCEDPHSLAWFTAREVVGDAGFEDCVIYLTLEEDDVLVQQAAIGLAKNPADRQIAHRLTISFGTGITGHVAATKQAEIVADVRQDARYVADVGPAGSEICVPILLADRVVGVIDCENPKAGFFNTDDLAFLCQVADLIAERLQAQGAYFQAPSTQAKNIGTNNTGPTIPG